jgi:hypothetical protein
MFPGLIVSLVTIYIYYFCNLEDIKTKGVILYKSHNTTPYKKEFKKEKASCFGGQQH